MAIDRSKIKTVKELNTTLKIGESYVVESIMHCPEYPNIPKEICHVKTEMMPDGTFRVIPWD